MLQTMHYAMALKSFMTRENGYIKFNIVLQSNEPMSMKNAASSRTVQQREACFSSEVLVDFSVEGTGLSCQGFRGVHTNRDPGSHK